MKRKDLDLPGLVKLGEPELKGIKGGAAIPAPVWWAVLWSAVNNFGDIREGFSDGISGKPPRY